MIRIQVLSSKGGVGKSVLSALLSLASARRGKKVILLDADPLGWSSYVLGHRGPGLIPSLLKEGRVVADTLSFSKPINDSRGSVLAVKLFGQGVRYEEDLKSVLFSEELSKAFKRALSLVYRGTADVIIADSPTMADFNSLVIKEELSVASEIFPDLATRNLYVTDPTTLSAMNLRTFMDHVEKMRKGLMGTVINMVAPLPSAMEEAESLASTFQGVVAVIPFIERLYNTELVSPNDIPHQITELEEFIYRPTPSFALIF
jgi:Mrp family chromosome partitioning ATPase